MKSVYIIISSMIWGFVFVPVQQAITGSSASVVAEGVMLGAVCSVISLALFFASDSFIKIRGGWRGIFQIILIPLIVCVLKLLSSQYYTSRFG